MAEPSYMMARRLRPRSERAAAGAGESAGAGAGAGASRAPGATALASRALMREARPEVVASGKRAAFIRVIEEAKAAQAAKEKVRPSLRPAALLAPCHPPRPALLARPWRALLPHHCHHEATPTRADPYSSRPLPTCPAWPT